jgi:hypothetical protein
MKSWHVVVMDGYRTVEDRVVLTVKEANDLYAELKAKYKVENPKYYVTRDYY